MKYIYTILAGITVVAFSAFASGANLYEHFILERGYFPSFTERAKDYESEFGEKYKGSAEQNIKFHSFLDEPKFGALAFPPSTVEGTSTAGWTDDGSVVRLNTAADFVGIGTVNPQEKLSIVGGNIFDAGTLAVGGGTFNFGNGSATSTFSASNARVGLGTTTPGNTFSVNGDSLSSGTSTAGGIVATSTLETKFGLIVASTTKWGNFTYHPPQTLGSNNDILRMRNGATNSASTFWDPASSVNDWIQVLSTTTDTADPNIRSGTFTTGSHLRIILQTTGLASAGTIGLTFNGDSGSNYGFKTFNDNSLPGGNALNAQTSIGLVPQATTSAAFFVIDIPNISGTIKLPRFEGTVSAGSAAIPLVVDGAGNWNNTASQITQINIASGVNFNVNTKMTIYRSNQ